MLPADKIRPADAGKHETLCARDAPCGSFLAQVAETSLKRLYFDLSGRPARAERSRVTICFLFAISSFLLSPARLPDAALQEGPAADARQPELPQILAFDLPPDLRSQADVAKIRTFVVGYFQGESVEPRWILEVPPNLTRILADGSVRLLLPLAADLPAGVYWARLKIRTASADSDWSAPSPRFTLPELVKRKTRSASSASVRAAKAQPPLKLDPSLAAAVSPLLPKGMELAAAAQGFQKPLPFLSALFVSRNLGLDLVEVKRKIFEKPGKTRSLSSVIGELRPDRDAKAEARKALSQAKGLAGDARNRRPPPKPPDGEWLPEKSLLSSGERRTSLPFGWLEAADRPGFCSKFTPRVAAQRWHGFGNSTAVPDPGVEASPLDPGGRA